MNENIRTRIQLAYTPVAESTDEIYVIFKSRPGLGGEDGDAYPIDFCVEAELGKIMVEHGEALGPDGWIIECRRETQCSSLELRAMVAAIEAASAPDPEWGRYIDLPPGTCSACGGSGVVAFGVLRGDCETCGGDGRDARD